MDIEGFFFEQDERMNMPDEDLKEYLKRMDYSIREGGAHNPITPIRANSESSKEPECVSLLLPPIHSTTTGDYESHALGTTSSTSCGDPHEPISQLIYPPQVVPHFDNRSNHDVSLAGSDIGRESSILFSHDHRPSRSSGTTPLLAPETPQTLRVEHQLLTHTLKGKASRDDKLRQRSQKERERSSEIYVSPSSSIEEITSFSIIQPPLKRQIPSANNQKPPKKRKIEALKLQTIVSAPAESDDPPTSPIEDASGLLTEASCADSTKFNSAGKPGALQGAPSRLYLEVKERIAQHTSSRRRDKVIKLAKMDTLKKTTISDESSIISSSSSPPHALLSNSKTATLAETTAKRAVKEKAKLRPTKGKKERPPQMTPVEYVRKLQTEITQDSNPEEKEKSGKKLPFKFLHDKYIFYTGGDMLYASERTRGRMDIIAKYGGNLLATYDASKVTHIVTDAQIRPTLRALGLKKLSEIPNHVPTVKWDWVISGVGKTPFVNKNGEMKVRMDDVWMHAAFSERIDAGLDHPASSSKGKEKSHGIEDISLISEFTQDKRRNESGTRSIHDSEEEEDADKGNIGHSPVGAPLSPPTSPHPPFQYARPSSSKRLLDERSSKEYKDPLSEFYAQARAERDSGWSRHGEADESDETADEVDEPVMKTAPKRGWTCDKRETQLQSCVNQDIINKLQELKELHQTRSSDDDRWRVFSYTKCIRALRNYPKRIKSFAEARSIRGVGDRTAEKIMEILETGDLRRIDYETTEDIPVTRLFQGIYGVGQSTAFKWYASGCRTLDDIVARKGGIKVTPAQEIGIRFYDDINDRMPRDEAKAIFELIKPMALKMDSKLFVEIMGSYRRGKADCGDIDIIITRPTYDGKTHKGILSRLLNDLHTAGILTEDLAVPENPDDLEAIYRGLCRLPKEGSRRRRIDFLTVPWHSRGAALLYYTGDDIFNRAIRMKANVLGYSLNQRGLFEGVVRDPKDRRIKLNTGNLIASETEEEIFKVLNVPWQEPHERVRG